MTKKEKVAVKPIDSQPPVDLKALEDFRNAMTNEVIPEIVRVVEERRLGAAQSRHWQLKC